MYKLTDTEFIDELKKRFDENSKTFSSMKALNKRLVDVNEKLLASEMLKSNFLSNIRNEMNNPLTSILCLSMMLFSGESLKNESIPSMARNLYSEALNLDFQLRNIFVAAEIEAGEADPNISIVDVDMLINSMIELFAFRAREKNITVDFKSDNISGGMAGFVTDPEKLQLVLSNLLSNAIKYGHEGGYVEINACREGENLNVSVKDNGIGIDESELKAVFERFAQVDAGTTKSHLGHGLGAAVTKSVIELLNGTICVSSEKGSGSEFLISIPEMKEDMTVDTYSGESNEFFFDVKEQEF